MTDLTAMRAARGAGHAADTEAQRLASRLVAAKADRAALRRDLVALPQRMTVLQGLLVAAKERARVAVEARGALRGQATAAQQLATSADATSRAADNARGDAQSNFDGSAEALQGEKPAAQRARRQALKDILDAATRRATDAAGAASKAHDAVLALAAQVAAAQTAAQAAQDDVTALIDEIATVQQALDAAKARSAAVEAQPAALSAEIVSRRRAVATAWAPWDAQLAAAHAAIAAAAASLASATSPAQVTAATAELQRLRAELVAGDSPDDLVALIGADVPLALLPVRLETRFDRHGGATDLLVRIYPDSVHVDTHEPELTADELACGRRYLEQERAAGADQAAALQAWRVLCDRCGPQRAAWIARAAVAATPPQRAEPWTRAATTNVLPDRWIALGYRGGERRFAMLGRPISDSLPVGPDPAQLGAGDPAAPLGAAAHWMVDFDRAVERGMALRIALSDVDSAGLDRLVVLGVRATGDGADGARRLSALLDAHHYTDGLVLLAPGTPTNNTDSSRSAWSTAGDDRVASLRAERGASLVSAGTDGDVLARALGIAADPLAHAAGANATAVADERRMRTALWPATWGYMLEQLAGGVSDEACAAGRAHAIANVAASGALPAMRLGRQPYGVLAVTSLERWRLLDPESVESDLPALLRALCCPPGERRCPRCRA